MKAEQERAEKKWLCYKCGVAMQPGDVKVAYLGSEFTVQLPKCPRCGLVHVPEELALGKMNEVEKTLEDK
ncbi:DVU_1557 family redox protein [Desulfolucanica intricata]|uniref:DVU_1557 family redox protein n=1 Tax=Desulfolucanica intricata TaxID=1285191 RepID=UPI0008312965|nr:CLJU_RS11820 family redox protein [Desulfolucanica intricata]